MNHIRGENVWMSYWDVNWDANCLKILNMFDLELNVKNLTVSSHQLQPSNMYKSTPTLPPSTLGPRTLKPDGI